MHFHLSRVEESSFSHSVAMILVLVMLYSQMFLFVTRINSKSCDVLQCSRTRNQFVICQYQMSFTVSIVGSFIKVFESYKEYIHSYDIVTCA
jgi:hypothetical protein